MLDLERPVQFIRCSDLICNVFPASKKGKYIVEYVDEEGHFFVTFANADELKNVQKQKVATALVSVYKSETEDIYLSCACPDNGGPMVKITYTEGAENPWQIEEVK